MYAKSLKHQKNTKNTGKTQSKLITNSDIIEVEGNVLEAPTDYTIGHYVSKDFKILKGISLEFRRQFGKIDQLIQQNKQVTEIATIQCNQRQILYIITKEMHYQTSTYETMFLAMKNLRQFCESNGLNKLALHKIDSEYDQLDWTQLKDIKAQLPTGEDIPVNLNDSGVSELLRLTTTNIVYIKDLLVFNKKYL